MGHLPALHSSPAQRPSLPLPIRLTLPWEQPIRDCSWSSALIRASRSLVVSRPRSGAGLRYCLSRDASAGT
jgi:hypothetical protein